MTEFIHLIGAEDVRSAGSAMRVAAEEMSHAAASIDESLRVHRLFLDDWLFRLEHIIKKEGEDEKRIS